MEKLDINAVHNVLLGIAKDVHRVLSKNNIDYYITAGTLLGAVRHKGFIPWDDDMDILIKRDVYEKALDVLSRELSPKFHVLTYENDSRMVAGFAKVEDTTTINDDASLKGKAEEKFGINIDIFPGDEMNDDASFSKYAFWKRMLKIKYNRSINDAPVRNALRAIVGCLIPFSRKFMIHKIEGDIQKERGNLLGTVWGRYGKREFAPKEYWGTPKLYDFEDTQLYGVEKYDDFLKFFYGDYMKLPPKEQQFVHGLNAYRK